MLGVQVEHLSQIAKATGISIPYASDIRRGRMKTASEALERVGETGRRTSGRGEPCLRHIGLNCRASDAPGANGSRCLRHLAEVSQRFFCQQANGPFQRCPQNRQLCAEPFAFVTLATTIRGPRGQAWPEPDASVVARFGCGSFAVPSFHPVKR
jgi:hypothetical protein